MGEKDGDGDGDGVVDDDDDDDNDGRMAVVTTWEQEERGRSLEASARDDSMGLAGSSGSFSNSSADFGGDEAETMRVVSVPFPKDEDLF